MTAIERVCAALDAAGVEYTYAKAPRNAAYPYIVYREYYTDFDRADNRIDEVRTGIQVDLYTKTPLDPLVEDVTAALDGAGLVFDIQHFYEDGQKIYHHVFDVSDVWSE